MVDRVLIDTLNLQAMDFALRWKERIRKSPHLKHYNDMTDQALIDANAPLYPLLARTLDRGLDRSTAGEFFVRLGKERVHTGFPVSEVIYGLNLVQQVIVSYLMNDFVLDSTVRMYQAMGVVNRVSEFFLLGCFYVTKGFLEETYTNMNLHDKISEELLKKYFKDDFFFKKD
ncbi:MAG: hypothetical protein FWG27_06175 [Treponema sp.]|nr:hypothetical protein [Treponema sp.]